MKRPHVDEFLEKMAELFECVLFTASLGKVRPHDLCSDVFCNNNNCLRCFDTVGWVA